MTQYKIKITNTFKKKLKKLQQQPNFKLENLDYVLTLLTNNKVLPAKYKNHLLEPKKKRYMGMPYTTRCFACISKN